MQIVPIAVSSELGIRTGSSTTRNGTLDNVNNLAEEPIGAVFTDPSYGKESSTECKEALENNAHLKRALEEICDAESSNALRKGCRHHEEKSDLLQKHKVNQADAVCSVGSLNQTCVESQCFSFDGQGTEQHRVRGLPLLSAWAMEKEQTRAWKLVVNSLGNVNELLLILKLNNFI
ncbi:hypothetical protein REPUB_Repub15cG0114700 [Reevesia pubescens]